jgi:hypothetical protein
LDRRETYRENEREREREEIWVSMLKGKIEEKKRKVSWREERDSICGSQMV